MPTGNPWEQWGIIYTCHDGYPVLTETALWQLTAQHPEVIERPTPTEMYVHLDQAYRVVTLSDRAYRELIPAPERKPPVR